MFVDQTAELNVGLAEARAALRRMISDGWLGAVSDQAYSDGLAGLIRVGPFGDVPGAAKLVRVLLLDPVDRDGVTTIPLRWEATGKMGRLFPVLDANLTLVRVDDETTRLVLNGAYRPPLSGMGESLDRMILHRAATATVRSLVRQIAMTISAPADAPMSGAVASFPPPTWA